MTEQVAIRIPTPLVQEVDELVGQGRFANRSEAIRMALERMLDDIRRGAIDAAIVAGYQRVPDDPPDAWLDAATRALIRDEPW